MTYRCPPQGCPDDLCRGTGECMATGQPLADYCTACDTFFFYDIEDCRCGDEHYESVLRESEEE